jgi:hypothetical protein
MNSAGRLHQAQRLPVMAVKIGETALVPAGSRQQGVLPGQALKCQAWGVRRPTVSKPTKVAVSWGEPSDSSRLPS